MKNSIFNAVGKTRYLALLVVLIFTCRNMWGASFAPSNFSGQGTSGTGSAISATVDGVTFACDKGYGGTQFRCYKNGKITISSSSTITAISFTFSGSYTGGLETSYTGLSTTSWEKTLSSQARITACTVTVAAGCGEPKSLTNGAVTASGQPVSWTAPSSAPANGYIVVVGATSTPPGDITMNNGAAYPSGDYYCTHVAAGTTNFTFGASQYVYAGTEYHWWVRSKCSSSDYSDWVAGTAFTIPSSCNKSVTINQGAATNCSFTLSKSGAQASCDGVSTTVTVSPSTGYGTPVVTESGASPAPTISGSGTSWTVAYGANTTGISAISVSCSANNYTITLNDNSGSGGDGTHAVTYNAATGSLTNTPTKTGHTFVGYWTSNNSGATLTTQVFNADLTPIQNVSGYTDNTSSKKWINAGNVTLYAKWTANTYTVTWKVNNTNYSAGGSTEVTHGNHVATLPTAPDPASYCGQKFMGWTTSEVVTPQAAAPSPLYTEASQFPNATGNQVFHAVFADYDD